MVSITLSVPDELKLRMDEVDIINWSSVARHAFAETLEDSSPALDYFSDYTANFLTNVNRGFMLSKAISLTNFCIFVFQFRTYASGCSARKQGGTSESYPWYGERVTDAS